MMFGMIDPEDTPGSRAARHGESFSLTSRWDCDALAALCVQASPASALPLECARQAVQYAVGSWLAGWGGGGARTMHASRIPSSSTCNACHVGGSPTHAVELWCNVDPTRGHGPPRSSMPIRGAVPCCVCDVCTPCNACVILGGAWPCCQPMHAGASSRAPIAAAAAAGLATAVRASANGSPQYDYDLFTIGAGSGGVRGSRFAASYGTGGKETA